MATSEPTLVCRPKRADARRNYDKLIEAARAAFTELGAEASLEEIARRADVGIGTLYRHFPTRQELIEAVYVDEVEALCRSAEGLDELPPWDALVSWLDGFVSYVGTKRALAEELMVIVGPDSPMFRVCHGAITTAGQPLVTRAQQAGAVRPDVTFLDVIRLVSGVTMIKTASDADIRRLLHLALDGLRYREPSSTSAETAH